MRSNKPPKRKNQAVFWVCVLQQCGDISMFSCKVTCKTHMHSITCYTEWELVDFQIIVCVKWFWDAFSAQLLTLAILKVFTFWKRLMFFSLIQQNSDNKTSLSKQCCAFLIISQKLVHFGQAHTHTHTHTITQSHTYSTVESMQSSAQLSRSDFTLQINIALCCAPLLF